MCPAAVNTRAQVKEFVDTAARHIATRLNSGAPGVNLTAQDAYAIMHLCPFDTVAKEAISPFCDLFSEGDFEVYEYAGDLEKFYNTGYARVVSPLLTQLIVFCQLWKPFGPHSRGRVYQRAYRAPHEFSGTTESTNQQYPARIP